MKKKIMLSCEETRHICDKTQYNEASFWEKVKFKFHVIICGVCKKHSSNNIKLTALLNKLKSKSLTNTEKQELESSFKKELQKHK